MKRPAPQPAPKPTPAPPLMELDLTSPYQCSLELKRRLEPHFQTIVGARQMRENKARFDVRLSGGKTLVFRVQYGPYSPYFKSELRIPLESGPMRALLVRAERDLNKGIGSTLTGIRSMFPRWMMIKMAAEIDDFLRAHAEHITRTHQDMPWFATD